MLSMTQQKHSDKDSTEEEINTVHYQSASYNEDRVKVRWIVNFRHRLMTLRSSSMIVS